MVEMDPRLRDATETGKIDGLRVLIREDPYIFEHIDKIPFADTPLHIAAKEGQIEFAMEMMNLKPSFARKLNPDGLSPMHLAVANGKTELVLRLLQTDKDLVLVKGTEGKTPFHCVVTMGNSQSQLLVEVLEACPECIEDVTVRNETALHLALIKEQMKAFNILIGWLQRLQMSPDTPRSILAFEKKIVNWKDKDNNTVLHIAAKRGQDEALKLLLDSQLWLEVKAKNSEGLTALQIIEKAERPSMDINMSGKDDDDDDPKIKQYLKKKVNFFRRIKVLADRLKNAMSVEVINTMLVVTALVLTATYQSSLSPPGGVWQDSSEPNTTTIPNITVTNHFLPDNNNNSILNFIYGLESKKPGTTVMNPQWFGLFWFLNFATFVLSIFLTVFLLLKFRLFVILLIPLYLLVISYFCSMTVLSPSTPWSIWNLCLLIIFEILPLFTLLVLLYVIRKSFMQMKAEIQYRMQMQIFIHKDTNVGIIRSFARVLAFGVFLLPYILDTIF
ncbi:hypothetical protein ES332_D05G335500v1 [Gossypium tomentosum]|nr:hypothetical protein ES332_D05G335500v1 [Gossypium tomentosum]